MVASAAGSEAKDAVSPLIAPVAETSGSSALGHDAQLAGEAAAVDTHAIAATRTKLLIERRVKTRGRARGRGPPTRAQSLFLLEDAALAERADPESAEPTPYAAAI